jgi:hypothetical protein
VDYEALSAFYREEGGRVDGTVKSK